MTEGRLVASDYHPTMVGRWVHKACASTFPAGRLRLRPRADRPHEAAQYRSLSSSPDAVGFSSVGSVVASVSKGAGAAGRASSGMPASSAAFS